MEHRRPGKFPQGPIGKPGEVSRLGQSRAEQAPPEEWKITLGEPGLDGESQDWESARLYCLIHFYKMQEWQEWQE